jgi:hypothetical protein
LFGAFVFPWDLLFSVSKDVSQEVLTKDFCFLLSRDLLKSVGSRKFRPVIDLCETCF